MFKEKLKILHIVPTYYPAVQYGGAITVTHEINKQLVKQGIDVTVFTTMDGQKPTVKPNIIHDVDGVKVVYIKSYFETGYGISLRFPAYLAKNIYKYDVIHNVSVFTFTSFFTPLICLIMKKPYIIASHGTLDPNMIQHKSGFIKKLAMNIYERFYLNRADAIHILVEDEAKWLKELNVFNTRIAKIPNGMECNKSIEKINVKKGNQINLLYLGRLNYKKNIDLILEAFSKLNIQDYSLKLVIAGPDDGSEKELKKLSKKLEIDNDVDFVGLVEGKEKENLLQECNIFLLPSKNEGLSMAQLEAMCARCAVIVGNRGGIHSELEKFNAGKVIEPNVENLMQAIESLVYDPDQIIEMGINARSLVLNEYNNSNILTKYIELYKRLKKSKNQL